MEKLIHDLRAHNETRAATWLERHWTGDRGRFSLGHAGYGCPNHNNGQESGWGRMKKKIPSDCAYYVFISSWQQWTAARCKENKLQRRLRVVPIFLSCQANLFSVESCGVLFGNSPFWMSGNGMLWQTMHSGWTAWTVSRNALSQWNQAALHVLS